MTDEQKLTIDNAIKDSGYVFTNGHFRYPKNNKIVNVEVIITKIQAIISALRIETSDVYDYLKQKEDSYVQTAGDSPITTYDVIVKFINEALVPKYNINAAFSHITNKNSVPLEKGIDVVFDELATYRANNGIKFNLSDLQAQLRLFIDSCKNKVADRIYQQIKFDENSVEKGNTCLSELYQCYKISEKYEIFETLMKQWIWLVKRKLLGRPVKWHIWLNFCGGTGLGKTVLIRKMCNDIFDDLYDEPTISKLFDDTREVKRLSTKYILNFDELAVNNNNGMFDEKRLTDDQMNMLKQLLTAEKRNTRVMGTQQQINHRITFTCISSSNSHLYDIIYDEETMRRYFEFNCTAVAKQKAIFKQINEKVTPLFLDLWKSVDEDLEDGYYDPNSEVGEEIKKIQSSYYPTKTTVIAFLKEKHFKVSDKDAAGAIKITDQNIFREYTQWCKESGYRGHKNKESFVSEVRKRNSNLKAGILYFVPHIINEKAVKENNIDPNPILDFVKSMKEGSV